MKMHPEGHKLPTGEEPAAAIVAFIRSHHGAPKLAGLEALLAGAGRVVSRVQG